MSKIKIIAKYTTNVFVTSRAKYDEDGNSLNDFEDLKTEA